MRSKAATMWLAVLLVFAGSMVLWAGWRRLATRESAQVAAEPSAAPADVSEGIVSGVVHEPLREFELTDQEGQPFDSRSLHGEVWVASFFFANCPQICRMQNMKVAELQQRYAGRGLKLISITCDPARDTPEALQNYARMFNADPRHWRMLTGEMSYIRRIGGAIFGVMIHEETHSDRLMAVDRAGKIRGSYRATQPDQFRELEKLLDQLLDEPPPPADGPEESLGATAEKAAELEQPGAAGDESAGTPLETANPAED